MVGSRAMNEKGCLFVLGWIEVLQIYLRASSKSVQLPCLIPRATGHVPHDHSSLVLIHQARGNHPVKVAEVGALSFQRGARFTVTGRHALIPRQPCMRSSRWRSYAAIRSMPRYASFLPWCLEAQNTPGRRGFAQTACLCPPVCGSHGLGRQLGMR